MRKRSVSVEPDSGFVVAAGCELGGERRTNVALLRFARDADGAWAFVHACAPFGVGRLSRGARHQVNSVRFGWARMPAAPVEEAAASAAPPAPPPLQRVLVVGSQDKHVYVFPVPTVPADGAPPPGPLRPLASPRFATAINCAAASPDGRFLASAGDREELYVTGSDDGYLAADVARHTLRLTTNTRMDNESAGCQYLAWSADTTRIAASSDTLGAVAVWAVPVFGAAPVFAQLARFVDHLRPVLALSFLPPPPRDAQQAQQAQQQLLCWAELEANAYVADVEHAAAADAWRRPLRVMPMGHKQLRRCAVQRVRLPEPAPQPEQQQMWPHGAADRRRITGLCVASGGRFLLAQQHAIYEFKLVAGWSKALHARFPSAFRAAARAFLLAAAAPPPGEGPGLCALPKDVLLQIIALAAQPQAAWLPPRPDLHAEAELAERRGAFPYESDAEMEALGEGDEDVSLHSLSSDE